MEPIGLRRQLSQDVSSRDGKLPYATRSNWLRHLGRSTWRRWTNHSGKTSCKQSRRPLRRR